MIGEGGRHRQNSGGTTPGDLTIDRDVLVVAVAVLRLVAVQGQHVERAGQAAHVLGLELLKLLVRHVVADHCDGDREGAGSVGERQGRKAGGTSRPPPKHPHRSQSRRSGSASPRPC